MTLKVRILTCLSRLFIILVSLAMTWFCEKMLISTRCILVWCPTWSKNLGQTLMLLLLLPTTLIWPDLDFGLALLVSAFLQPNSNVIEHVLLWGFFSLLGWCYVLWHKDIIMWYPIEELSDNFYLSKQNYFEWNQGLEAFLFTFC